MKLLSIDIEHSYGAFRPHEQGFYISCIGAVMRETGKPERREVVWFDHCDVPEPDHGKSWEAVKKWVEWADTLVAHNTKHDMTICRNYGISFEDVDVWCTMVGEYLLSGQDMTNVSVDLSSVSQRHGLAPKIDKVRVLWDQGIDTYDIPTNILEEYVLDDCWKAAEIYESQQRDVDREGMRKLADLQMEFVKSLSDMELHGFNFDAEQARGMIVEFESKLAKLDKELKDIIGVPDMNIGSYKQKSALLFGGVVGIQKEVWEMKTLKTKPETIYKPMMRKVNVFFEGGLPANGEYDETVKCLGFEPPTKKRNSDGSVPTDKAIIEQLRCKTPTQKIVRSALSEHGIISKAMTTLKSKSGNKETGLLNKIGLDGMIHSSLNQTVARTGRLTSSDPNSQNMPREGTSPIKQCIVPLNDWIMQCDLSQIEWRAAAWLSQDKVMMHEINSGIDQHSRACTELMEMELNKENRNFAKIFNFRMIYGGVAYGYYKDTKMPNFPLYKWEQIVNDFQNKYYGLSEWQQRNITHVNMEGELQLPTGRRFVFVRGPNHDYSERQIKNYPVQGLAGGDIMPLMIVVIRRGMHQRKMKSRMILTVHDSVVFDVLERERDDLIDLVGKCVSQLPAYVSNYYGIDWNVKLEGEIEIGRAYGDLSLVAKV